MRKKYIYKCQFTSVNSTGVSSYHCISVMAYNLKEAQTLLRSYGYTFGKDFVYWKIFDNSPHCPKDINFIYAYKK